MIVDRLLKWIEVPINVLMWLALIAGTAMMLHVTVDVTARTVFNSPLAGTTEIVAGWYMVVCCYLPWAWVARRDNHITAEIFSRIGTERFSFWLEICVKLLTLVYISVFAFETYLRAVQQMQRGEVWQIAGGFIPIWPSRWALPVASGLMSIYLMLRIWSDIQKRLSGVPVHAPAMKQSEE